MTDPQSRLGSVVRHGDGVTLRFERSFDAPVEDVWSAVTDPEQLSRWFGSWTGDPAEGRVQLRMVDEPDEQGPTTVTITTCRRPEVLEVRTESPDGPWPLAVRLRRDGHRTLLTFTHELAEPYDAGSIGPGWHYYLDRLDAVLTGTPPTARWEDYHPRLAEQYRLPEA